MAWVVGKWAWVDGTGSKVLFAQMEWSWVLGISSKLSHIAVIPGSHCSQKHSQNTNKLQYFAVFC